jgi:hypothetical protein
MQSSTCAERGFGGDGGMVPAEAERAVGDRDVEVFGHLALAEYGTERLADGRGSTQRVACSLHSGPNARRILFGGRQQDARARRRYRRYRNGERWRARRRPDARGVSGCARRPHLQTNIAARILGGLALRGRFSWHLSRGHVWMDTAQRQ